MSGILECRGVAKHFGGFTALSDVHLSIRQGEIRCLLGPNGAGKTTLLELFSGKYQPTEGQVLYEGGDISGWGEDRRARSGISRKFQSPSVFKELSVVENLHIGFARNTNPFRNLIQFRRFSDETLLEEVLELTQLHEYLDHKADELSHGQTQWLEIGMVLMQQPKVLLMDEPTAGMTSREKERVANVLNRLKGEKTIVVVEHDMEFVRLIAETVTVMNLGSVFAEGSLEYITEHQGVKDIYLGHEGAVSAGEEDVDHA